MIPPSAGGVLWNEPIIHKLSAEHHVPCQCVPYIIIGDTPLLGQTCLQSSTTFTTFEFC